MICNCVYTVIPGVKVIANGRLMLGVAVCVHVSLGWPGVSTR